MEKYRRQKNADMFNFLTKVDIFEEPVPTHNLSGKKGVGTIIGGLTSLAMFYIMFLFGLAKLLHLIQRQNPTVNTYTRKDAFANDSKLSLADSNFQMAFSLENYITGESLADPRYVKWTANVRTIINDQSESRELPIYACRDQDFAKFYPIDEKSKSKLHAMKTDPKKQLYCIDWEQAQIELYGLESVGNASYFMVSAVPCNQKLTMPFFGGVDDRISEDCIWDLDAQQDYI